MRRADQGVSVSVKKKVRIAEPTGRPQAAPQLGDLSTPDKAKISKLVEKVLELGREKESLTQQLETLQQSRQDDVLIAVGTLRSELQQKNEMVADLHTKRQGALELLQRYQNKISDLAATTRNLKRIDTESKAQLSSLRAELNNLQQLLETQSQTIQSYRLQLSATTMKESGEVELREALRRRTSEAKAAETRTIELEGSMQHLQEQISSLRSVMHEKDKQIVELNNLLFQQSSGAVNNTVMVEESAPEPLPRDANRESQVLKHSPKLPVEIPEGNDSTAPYTLSKEIEKLDVSSSESIEHKQVVQPAPLPSSWGDRVKDQDFIGHLERIAKEKKKKKEEESHFEDDSSAILLPPPRVHSPPLPNDASFDDSFSTVTNDEIVSPASGKVKAPATISGTGKNYRLSKNQERLGSTAGKYPSVNSRNNHTSLSSSASTLIKTVSKKSSSLDAMRNTYGSVNAKKLQKASSNNDKAPEYVKFRSMNRKGVVAPRTGARSWQTENINSDSKIGNNIAMYNPSLFEMLDEMDSRDSSSTISSIL